MNLHYDKKTGRANEVVEKDLASAYRKAIEKVTEYLSLELSKYNRISMEEVPNDVCYKAHQFIDNIRSHFIYDTLTYYLEQDYITSIDCKNIYKSFNKTIAQLEDIYLYKTIYEKSSFHLYWISDEQVRRTPVLFFIIK